MSVNFELNFPNLFQVNYLSGSIFSLAQNCTSTNWELIYAKIKEHPELLHEGGTITNGRFYEDGQISKSILWILLCENKPKSSINENLKLAIKLIELDPTVNLNLKAGDGTKSILEGLLAQSQSDERTQLLYYFLILGVSIPTNLDATHKQEIENIQKNVNDAFSRGLEVFKLHHIETPFASLPHEICWIIAMDAMQVSCPYLFNFSNELIIKKTFNSYFEKKDNLAKNLIQKRDWDEIYEILKTKPHLLQYQGGKTVLWKILCQRSDRFMKDHLEILQLALKVMELNPNFNPNEMHENNETMLSSVLGYPSCELRTQVLHYLILCGSEIPENISYAKDELEYVYCNEINQISSTLNAALINAKSIFKITEGPLKLKEDAALQAFIQKCPLLAKIPSDFLLYKMNGPKAMIKV